MTDKELVEINKEKILPELEEWAASFEWELDDEGEPTSEPYNEVFDLTERLRNGTCTDIDYTNILFHIEQLNYNEIRVRL